MRNNIARLQIHTLGPGLARPPAVVISEWNDNSMPGEGFLWLDPKDSGHRPWAGKTTFFWPGLGMTPLYCVLLCPGPAKFWACVWNHSRACQAQIQGWSLWLWHEIPPLFLTSASVSFCPRTQEWWVTQTLDVWSAKAKPTIKRSRNI